MTLTQAQRQLERQLLEANFDSPRADAQILLEWVTHLSALELRLQSARELTPEQIEQLERAVGRRLECYPLQLIVGEAWFYGLPLGVRPGVLIPRPETEVLVNLALKRLPLQARVLDLGTGTGAIALALKRERPDLQVWATDVSLEALELAKVNAQSLELDIHLLESDLFSGVTGRFHAIVSNPPYLPVSDRNGRPSELETEPDNALYSGFDGLELARELVACAPDFLEPDGFVLLELDPRNVGTFAAELEEWRTKVKNDLTGRRRFLWLERI